MSVMDDKAFSALLAPLEQKLYLTAVTILKNPEDAKDALQETYLLAYRKWGSLKDEAAFPAWITKILLRQAYRSSKKRRLQQQELCLEKSAVFCETVTEPEWQFFEYLCNLEESYKTIVILKYYHGFTLEQISQMLKLPLSTVKTRLYRAHSILREEIGGQWHAKHI